MRSRLEHMRRTWLAAAGGLALAVTGSCDVGLDGLNVYVNGDPYCCDDGYFEFGGSYFTEEPLYYDEYYYEEGYYEEGGYFP